MYSRCDKKSVIPIAIFDQFAYFIYIQSMCNSTQNAHKHLARITNDRAKFNILLVCPAKYSVSHINTTQHALIVPRDRSARVSSARATLYMCHRIIWHAFDDTPKIFNRTPSRTNSNSITCDVLASTLVRASHPRCARALGMREPLISRTVCCALYFVRKWQVASCLSTAVYLCVCVCRFCDKLACLVCIYLRAFWPSAFRYRARLSDHRASLRAHSRAERVPLRVHKTMLRVALLSWPSFLSFLIATAFNRAPRSSHHHHHQQQQRSNHQGSARCALMHCPVRRYLAVILSDPRIAYTINELLVYVCAFWVGDLGRWLFVRELPFCAARLRWFRVRSFKMRSTRPASGILGEAAGCVRIAQMQRARATVVLAYGARGQPDRSCVYMQWHRCGGV